MGRDGKLILGVFCRCTLSTPVPLGCFTFLVIKVSFHHRAFVSFTKMEKNYYIYTIVRIFNFYLHQL